MHAPLHLAAAAALVLLAACAAPRYQTVYRYEAPTDAVRACAGPCDKTLLECQSRCRQKRPACLKDIEPEVDARYAEALKRHAADLNLYRLELERYRYNLWFDWGRGPWWHDPWWPPYYLPLPPPVAPNRERIGERLGQERCDGDCGCRGGHDACFTACGGKKVEETRCIANCPPE